MKREKIYAIPIDRPLNAARRKALEKNIVKNAALAPKDFEYGWDEQDDNLLHIIIDPVKIEVSFLKHAVEVFATAPLWASLGFTEKRRAQLRDLVETVLAESKLIERP